MIKRALCVVFVLCCTVNASAIPELRQCKSSADLALFIYTKATQDVDLGELLIGIRNPEKLRIPSYKTAIPIKEIYGTIIKERFGDALGTDFFETGRSCRTREICAFRDSADIDWRFHISVYDKRQYRIMDQFLQTEIKKRTGS